MNREIKVRLKTLIEGLLQSMRNNNYMERQYAYLYSDILELSKKEWFTYKSGYTPKIFNDYGGRVIPYVGRHGYGYIILTNELELTTQYSRARYMILAETFNDFIDIVCQYRISHLFMKDILYHYTDQIEKIVKVHGTEVKW